MPALDLTVGIEWETLGVPHEHDEECLVGPASRRAGRPIRVYRQGPRGGWRRVTREEVYRCVGS